MIKYYTRIIYCFFAIAFTSAMADSLSNSAPASTTGAPGEKDCTTSGCHESFALNSGQGSNTLSVLNGASNYIPSNTYTLTAEVAHPNLNRFGFQVVAIKDKDSSNVGTFTCTEQSRTQLISGAGGFANRNYITYTYDGTNAVSQGKGKWQFNWTAPVTNEGNITFYLATVAANDDGNDLGDYCYTKSLTLQSATTSIKQSENNIMFNVFPNPANDKIAISYYLDKPSSINIELYDIKGNKLQQQTLVKGFTGNNLVEMNLHEHEAGIYFIKLEMDNKSMFEKIILFN
ncbi:MAG: choice-of-anchor V domain-containing protein [Bacteroidota bacterium]|nr:choice-of-anchor V domain-containing protein [Bacteroidota bacterium]